ncbi:SDR family oxidoreductase [Nocardia sp. NBC_00416]|uniref:SDR family oxidoreductase n=1 Tax=Nocardia sp. NBC_00416 TaxID=2975991 RepID=UPI002E1B0166
MSILGGEIIRTIHGNVIASTGASGGIGEATAHRLAGLGAAVVLGARRTDRLDRLVAEIDAAGCRAVAARVDVTVPADLESLVDLAVGREGAVMDCRRIAGFASDLLRGSNTGRGARPSLAGPVLGEFELLEPDVGAAEIR